MHKSSDLYYRHRFPAEIISYCVWLGTPFKSDRHEAMLGCEEGRKILLTIYPAYLVGNRVFEKALVFTVPEEETKSADEKSERKDEIEGN